MKSLQLPSSAIFFVTNFYRAVGGDMVSSPPQSTTAGCTDLMNRNGTRQIDWSKGSLPLSDSVTISITNVTLTGKIDMQPILPSH